ncbi:MAG: hypothetical protein WAR79_16545 [Melioribacteraceae bacterium]
MYNKKNFPGFISESFHTNKVNNNPFIVKESTSENNIIPQFSRLSGNFGGFGGYQKLGFWRELGCALLCAPLFENPPLYAACVVTCIG